MWKMLRFLLHGIQSDGYWLRMLGGSRAVVVVEGEMTAVLVMMFSDLEAEDRT